MMGSQRVRSRPATQNYEEALVSGTLAERERYPGRWRLTIGANQEAMRRPPNSVLPECVP